MKRSMENRQATKRGGSLFKFSQDELDAYNLRGIKRNV